MAITAAIQKRLFSIAAAAAIAAAFLYPAAAADDGDNLLRARKAYLQGRHAAFLKYAGRIGGDSVLRPVADYWAADWDIKRGKPAAAEEYLRASPSAYFAAELRRDLLRDYALRSRWRDYERLLADGLSPPPPCAEIRHGLRAGTLDAARAQEIWHEATKADKLCVAAFREAASAGLISDDDIWRKLRNAAGSRRLRLARTVMRIFPRPHLSYRTLRNVAHNARRYLAAKHGLQTRAARELVMISAMVTARRDPAFAAARWLKFSPYFKEHNRRAVWSAIGEWGARRHHNSALAWFARGDGDGGESARAWRVRAAIRAGDYKTLAAAIDAMPEEQQAISAWRYWRAKAFFSSAAGKNPRLALRMWRELAADTDDFYGLLAREEMLNFPAETGEEQTRLAPQTPTDTAADTQDILIALALRKLNLKSEARRMWRFAAARLSASGKRAAAQTAQRDGWYLASIDAADKAADVRDKNGDALRFPTPYFDLVGRYADKLALDKSFVYGLIRQESRFMAGAVSRANARGLMQVLPSTARLVARRHKFTRYKLSRLTRADTNIIIGTHYIADLSRGLNRDPVLIAAAYNAGPGRAKRWRGGGELSALVYIETIPLTETRLYVKHLLANRVHYDRVFQAAPRSLKALATRPIGEPLIAAGE